MSLSGFTHPPAQQMNPVSHWPHRPPELVEADELVDEPVLPLGPDEVAPLDEPFVPAALGAPVLSAPPVPVEAFPTPCRPPRSG
jgi:hypothetical protein